MLILATPVRSQQEVEAARTSREGNAVVWFTNALRMPDVDKHKDVCARTPGYMDGAICYKICGGGLTSAPGQRELQWRTANMGGNTPFTPCDKEGQGCWIGAVEYYGQSQRGCVTAMIWKGQTGANKQKDFKVIQHLQ